MTNSQGDLRSELDQLATKGARNLRGFALKEALEASSRLLFPSSLVVPCLLLISAVLGPVLPALAWPFSIVWTLVGFLALPFAAVALGTLYRYAQSRVDRRLSLARFDHALGLKDRLVSADEYLARGARDDFEQAAIEDAQPVVSSAFEVELESPRIRAPALNAGEWRLGALSVPLFILGVWLLGVIAPQVPQGDVIAAPADLVADTRMPEEVPEEANNPDQEEEILPQPRTATTSQEKRETPAGEESGQFTQGAKPPPSRSLSATSESMAMSRAPNPSTQATAGPSGKTGSDASQREPARRRPPGEKREQRPETDEEPQPATGLKGGKGTSTGMKTASSELPSSEDKSQTDALDADADTDAEEEDEEQEAASATRPLINQRKAPVNRSLSPSANSDQENPDANGRGGPGGLKKTRGVAAMLLGVPLPDYLAAKANPGRIKVQRNSSQAEEKQVEQIPAEEREARDASFGRRAYQSMPPWAQTLVRDYFLSQREADKSTST